MKNNETKGTKMGRPMETMAVGESVQARNSACDNTADSANQLRIRTDSIFCSMSYTGETAFDLCTTATLYNFHRCASPNLWKQVVAHKRRSTWDGDQAISSRSENAAAREPYQSLTSETPSDDN